MQDRNINRIGFHIISVTSCQRQDMSFLQRLLIGSGTHSASFSVGIGALTLGVQQPGHEANPLTF
jgi:hypothetical protein